MLSVAYVDPNGSEGIKTAKCNYTAVFVSRAIPVEHGYNNPWSVHFIETEMSSYWVSTLATPEVILKTFYAANVINFVKKTTFLF